MFGTNNIINFANSALFLNGSRFPRYASLYFDGTCKQNGQKNGTHDSGCGYYVVPEVGKSWGGYAYLGKSTSLIAEYNGLIHGLRDIVYCKYGIEELDIEKLDIYGDCKIIIDQLNEKRPPKNQRLIPYYTESFALIAMFETVNLYHIPRYQNSKADYYAKLSIVYKESMSEL